MHKSGLLRGGARGPFYFERQPPLPVSCGLAAARLTQHVRLKALLSPCRVIAREERRADASTGRPTDPKPGLTATLGGFKAPPTHTSHRDRGESGLAAGTDGGLASLSGGDSDSDSAQTETSTRSWRDTSGRTWLVQPPCEVSGLRPWLAVCRRSLRPAL